MGRAVAAQSSTADAVIAWNANAGKAAIAACISPTDNPLHESRMYAMTHVAIHDALNAIDRRSRPYAFDATSEARAPRRTPRWPRPRATCSSRCSARSPAPFPPACIDAGVASVEADYAAALAAIPDGPAKTRGRRRRDRPRPRPSSPCGPPTARTRRWSTSTTRRAPSPGEYRFTPGPPFAFAPGWATSRRSCCDDSSQFRPGPPYAVTGRKYAADFNEVKRLGGDGVTTPSARTAEQTEIALFWVESSPLQWNRIARTVSADAGLDLWEKARLFGLLNMALADGYIGSFETKYHYNFWRPVTAIQHRRHRRQPATPAPTRPGRRW